MARLFATAIFLVAFACSVALASEPGQPLDCSDWVFVEPGLSCSYWIPAGDPACDGNKPLCFFNEFVVNDNDNRSIFFEDSNLGPAPAPCNLNGSDVHRSAIKVYEGGASHTVAFVDNRCGSGGSQDQLIFEGISFSATAGRLMIKMRTNCAIGPSGGCSYAQQYLVFGITGFTTMFGVLQSFLPSTSSLGFRVPYMPEGMGGADHFDTYWGSLAHPIDFTQAHSLQCGYPAAPPRVGDYLTVADTVPTPSPGQGVYYVTSATYQGATRYGRKATAGHLSGRDPAVLPACPP